MDVLGLRLVTAIAMVLGFASAGCNGCRREKPFAPFTVGSTSTATAQATTTNPVASSESNSASPAASNAQDAFPAEGERVAPDTQRVSVGARQAEAPKGMTFQAILRGDWNGDGNVDGLAVLRSSQPESPTVGAIYHYDGAGDPKALTDLPGWLPSRGDCAWQTSLRRTGKTMVAVDLRLECAAAMPSRAPTHYLAIIAPMRGEPLVASWRMAGSAPDEAFDVALSGNDLDGDGQDDVTLSLSLTHLPSKQKARAEAVWMDRAAGISREPGHFGASLAGTLAALDKLAAKKSTATDAIAGTSAVWRLIGSACAESGTHRIYRSDGSGLTCDNLSNTVVRLASIEAHASITLGNLPQAAFALNRADFMLGVHPSSSDRAAWSKMLAKSLRVVSNVTVSETTIKPQVLRTSVHFSPLRYLADGTLAVQTARDVLKVDTEGHEKVDEDASAPLPRWPLAVTASDGRVLQNVLPACDRSELLLAITGNDGRLLPTETTHFLAPRPGVCTGATSVKWRVSPINFTAEGPTAMVEGACISPKGDDVCANPSGLGPVVAGSPRSPDGHRLVVATGMGLLTLAASRTELWSSDSVGNPTQFSECVIDNSGDHVACVRNANLVLLSKAPAAEP